MFVTWSDGFAANPRTIDMTGIDVMTLSPIWERSTGAGYTSTRHFTFESNTTEGLLDRSSFYTVGDGANRWVIGEATANTAGTWGGESSLYVSNDGGAHNAYDDASQTYTYAELRLQAGYYQISFDYKVAGNEGDNLTVALFDDSAAPDSLMLDSARRVLCEGLTGTGTTWGDMTRLVHIADNEAGWYRLAFFWNTDEDGTVHDPAAAIDNIFLTYQSEIGDRFVRVSVNSNNPTMGKAIAYEDNEHRTFTEHDYYYGQEIIIEARVLDNDLYRFVGWSDGCTTLKDTLSFEDLWGVNRVYTAYFETIPMGYTVSVEVIAGTEDKVICGVVAGTHYIGDEVYTRSVEVRRDGSATLYAALPLGNWAFMGWLNNETGDTLRANPYTVTAYNRNITFTAVIKEYQECNEVTDEYDDEGNPLFLNPTDAEIHIAVENGQIVVDGAEEMEVSVYDAAGRLIERRVERGARRVFDVSAGMYIVKVGNMTLRRVVVVK